MRNKIKLFLVSLLVGMTMISTLGLIYIKYKNDQLNNEIIKHKENIVILKAKNEGWVEAEEVNKNIISKLKNDNIGLASAIDAKNQLINQLKNNTNNNNNNTDNTNDVTDVIDTTITGGAVSIGETTFKCGKIGNIKVGTEASCGFNLIRLSSNKYIGNIIPNAKVFDIETGEVLLTHTGSVVKKDILVEPNTKVLKIKETFPKWTIGAGIGISIPRGPFTELNIKYKIFEFKPKGFAKYLMPLPGKNERLSFNFEARGQYYWTEQDINSSILTRLNRTDIKYVGMLNYSFNFR